MTLDKRELAALARKVRFENWVFEVGPDTLYIRTLCKDNYTGKDGSFTFRFTIPPMECEDKFITFVMSKVEKIVLHEAQEKVHYDGVRQFDPHATRKGLWVDTSRLVTTQSQEG